MEKIVGPLNASYCNYPSAHDREDIWCNVFKKTPIPASHIFLHSHQSRLGKWCGSNMTLINIALGEKGGLFYKNWMDCANLFSMIVDAA